MPLAPEHKAPAALDDCVAAIGQTTELLSKAFV
jgi:acetyl esterase/lipase